MNMPQDTFTHLSKNEGSKTEQNHNTFFSRHLFFRLDVEDHITHGGGSFTFSKDLRMQKEVESANVSPFIGGRRALNINEKRKLKYGCTTRAHTSFKKRKVIHHQTKVTLQFRFTVALTGHVRV